jgi:hypothetical protein
MAIHAGDVLHELDEHQIAEVGLEQLADPTDLVIQATSFCLNTFGLDVSPADVLARWPRDEAYQPCMGRKGPCSFELAEAQHVNVSDMNGLRPAGLHDPPTFLI